MWWRCLRPMLAVCTFLPAGRLCPGTRQAARAASFLGWIVSVRLYHARLSLILSCMTSKLLATLLLIVGLAVAGAGAVLGFAAITVQGLDCGSAFSPEYGSSELDIALFGGQSCAEATSTRKTLALALVIPGVVVLAGGGVLGGVEVRRHNTRREAAAAASASAASDAS